MERTPALTEATIRDLARPQSYDRGEDYYERGAVFDVTRRGDLLQAAVEGSQYDPYQVQIELDETGIVGTQCSCPYDHGGICKHRVAVLLTYIRAPDGITQRLSISELVADTDPEELRDLLVDLVERRPELAEWIEARLEAARSEGASDDSRERSPLINQDAIRRRVRTILRSPRGGSPRDPYVAVKADVEELENLLEQAWIAINAGDGETALDVLEPLADELMDEEWLGLSYDDSQGIFELLDELDHALAEALLTTDLSEADRDHWEDQLQTWANEMEGYTNRPPYNVALEAVKHGWDSDPIQQVMQGEISDADLWEEEPPWYAEDVISARLNVLERQDRIEEYLNLATAADLTNAYVTMLVTEGRVEEAIEYGRTNLSSPDEALTLATVLRNHKWPDAALEVARQGLTLDGSGKAELATWLRDWASSVDEDEIALEAAIAAFKVSPSLAAYQATEELAGEDWSAVQADLLEYLSEQATEQWTARQHVEIFLYADQYDEAIDIADRFPNEDVVKPVVKAVWKDRSQWAIDACKTQAEPIIEQGQSQRYRDVVQWLGIAGKAAHSAGRGDAWCAYLEDLVERHSRKYKLVPLLEELFDEFSC
ncbi:Uncharacterized conserved protein, contains Zn finger domain [Halogranum amylolyticum]|uniref:Uncharacterized conserved protein, contains Zn finger domain n=1 Tax=Halogranum amylolyticum TaxID=660520 RepID=A0A1H8W789_9EURY|nr:SWIM zinc finger family protein [Halogranum amylolyticum]SEP22998.1 Uncharacterized conserved protein, contains Zn finger domain [Halogranum amylolyticum]